MRDIKKPRIGLVGEILVKFHPTANNKVVELVEAEANTAGEAMSLQPVGIVGG